MNTMVIFALWFLAAEAILSVVQILLRKKKIKPAMRACLIAGKLLLAVLLAFLPMAGPVQLRRMIGFRFEKDKNYNLPVKRLKVIESWLQSRVQFLLSI